MLLPAQLVFLEAPAGDPHVAVPTSNGLACARTFDDAVVAGLLELVERDAFMLVWSNRLSLPLLDWRDDAGLVKLDERYFATTGLDYAAVDCSCFLDVPVALGVVHGPPGEHGALGVGAAAAPTVGEAWWKALSEAFAVRRWARDSGFEHALDEPLSEWEIQSFEQHVLWWADPERTSRAAFLDASPERRPVATVAELEGDDSWSRVEAICRRLERRGLSGYAVDVTAPDIREAGLWVARAVVPELCGLDVVHGIRYLGGRAPVRRPGRGGTARPAARPLRAQSRPAPVPVSRTRTVPWAGWVYGTPEEGDPAELFHEASRLSPFAVDHRTRGLALLARSPELAASTTRAVLRSLARPARRASARLASRGLTRRSRTATALGARVRRRARHAPASSPQSSTPRTASPRAPTASPSVRCRPAARSTHSSSTSSRGASTASSRASTTSTRSGACSSSCPRPSTKDR